MQTSFDEVRKIAYRALNGAGAPPGIDDDGGWACAWLEAAGYPGLRMLADFLDDEHCQTKFEGVDSIADCRVDAAGRSAVTLAGPIIEYAASQPGPVEVLHLGHAPYLIAQAARLSSHGVSLDIAPLREAACNVTVRHGSQGYRGQQAKVDTAIQEGLEVDNEAFKRVYAYSREILVPQSETSLLQGAGAGLTDND